jgi:hypothetical protein
MLLIITGGSLVVYKVLRSAHHWFGSEPPNTVTGQVHTVDGDVKRSQCTDVSGYVSGLRTTRQSGHWLRRTDERTDRRTDGRTDRASVSGSALASGEDEGRAVLLAQLLRTLH